MFKLVVGLGNPGHDYAETRHNLGFWFMDVLSEQAAIVFRLENRFHAQVTSLSLPQGSVWLAKPNTYVNRTGMAVRALAQFYRLSAHDILIIHDELDLPLGSIKHKVGGGHAGHNGLRSIIAHLGSSDFSRIRIGIGRPPDETSVVDHVLSVPSLDEKNKLMDAIKEQVARCFGGGFIGGF